METIEQILNQYFPEIANLYAHQEELLKGLGRGENCLGVIPNGGGRSLIFQIQAMREPGLTIVISPLQSFADQQVRMLNQRGIPAATLNGGKSFEEQRTLLRTLPQSKLKLLYLSPEWLETTLLTKALEACCTSISLIVIDQAHAISERINQWGGAFRTDYGRIPALLETLRHASCTAKVLALTATLALEPRHEIIQRLHIGRASIPDSIIRPNLKFHFREIDSDDDKPLALHRWLESTEWTKGLVYAFSRKRCQALAQEFRRLGFRADYFHSLRPEAEKRDVYRRYENGDLELLFATSAYGTGLGVTDIDTIVNYQIAHSVQDYYQMVGRGWRRRGRARDCCCLLFWSHGSFDIRHGWFSADETALNDIGYQIERLYGADRKSVRAHSLKSVRLTTLGYARVGGILRNLYPLLVDAGVIEHLGVLPADPHAIQMHKNTPFWAEVLSDLKSTNESGPVHYDVIEQTAGVRFDEVCRHIYMEELAGNIREFPANQDHHVFFRVLKPEPDETTLTHLKAQLKDYIDLQRAEHEELRALVTSSDCGAFLQGALS